MKCKLLPKWQIPMGQVCGDSAPLGLKHLPASPAIPGHPRGNGGGSLVLAWPSTPLPLHPPSACSVQSGISFGLRTAPGFLVFLNQALCSPWGAAVSKQENTPAFTELVSHVGTHRKATAMGQMEGVLGGNVAQAKRRKGASPVRMCVCACTHVCEMGTGRDRELV